MRHLMLGHPLYFLAGHCLRCFGTVPRPNCPINHRSVPLRLQTNFRRTHCHFGTCHDWPRPLWPDWILDHSCRGLWLLFECVRLCLKCVMIGWWKLEIELNVFESVYLQFVVGFGQKGLIRDKHVVCSFERSENQRVDGMSLHFLHFKDLFCHSFNLIDSFLFFYIFVIVLLFLLEVNSHDWKRHEEL